MSYLKINENQFLGSQELKRLIQFLSDDSFRYELIQNTKTFGIVKNESNNDFSNGKVALGTNSGTIKVNNTFAIDSNGNFVKKEYTDNIAITNDSQWYWVQLSYVTSPNETGVVSVDADGNLTGVGTGFASIMRGITNRETVIRFTNATNNNNVYRVAEVLSDTNCKLYGTFTAETNLKFCVVGTFDPSALSNSHKDIFQYDSSNFILSVNSGSNTPPSPSVGLKFNLARVRNVAGVIEIQDKRDLNIFQTRDGYELTRIPSLANQIIGVEAIKFAHSSTPQVENRVEVAWGFRSSNWSISTSSNTINVNGGLGGRWKSPANFSADSLNGWRCYTKNGKYSIIVSCIANGSNFNIILDTLNESDYVLGEEIFIAPDAENIEIEFTPITTSHLQNVSYTATFPINTRIGVLYVVAYDSTSLYNFTYRYKNNKLYTPKTKPQNDTVGYYSEVSFDSNGEINPNTVTQVPYNSATDGFIAVTRSLNSYINTISKVDSGVTYGVEEVDFDSKKPVYSIVSSVNKNNQIITNVGALSTDYFITLNNNAKDGSVFVIKILGGITFNSNDFIIVQDYISALDYTEIKKISDYEKFLLKNANNSLNIILTFNNTLKKWVATGSVDGLTGFNGTPNNNFFGEDVDWDIKTVDATKFTQLADPLGIFDPALDANLYNPIQINLVDDKKYYRIVNTNVYPTNWVWTAIMRIQPSTNQKIGDEIIIELDNALNANVRMLIYDRNMLGSNTYNLANVNALNPNIKCNKVEYLDATTQHLPFITGSTSDNVRKKSVIILKFIYSPSKNQSSRSGEWKEVSRSYLFS